MLASYSSYYNESRTHLALEKDAPCELSRGAERSSPRQLFPDCTIAIRGYDFREGPGKFLDQNRGFHPAG
jgi:hypothetical protein